MENITLKNVCEDNFISVFNLKLSEGQEEFVSHPIRSLAQAYVYRMQCCPFAICDGETVVGYVMVIYDYDTSEYNIWHMMIDAGRQGRGYGKRAFALVLDYIRTKPFGNSDRVSLTCNKLNKTALSLYSSFGFSPTGNEDGDEIEMAVTL